MAVDDHVAKVLWAIEIIEGRVRAATRMEIARLVALDEVDLDHVLRRAVVGGWAVKLIVRTDAERGGVRAGTEVYRLTPMAHRRTPASELSSAGGA